MTDDEEAHLQDEFAEVVAKLEDIPELVLIGGQAVYFWQAALNKYEPRLNQLGPVTSEDIDFQANPKTVKLCAERFGTQPLKPKNHDSTTSSGKVLYKNAKGVEKEIDFLLQPLGLDSRDVLKRSAAVTLPSAGRRVSMRVMSPIDCLVSRIYNVAQMGRSGAPSMRQLAASILSVRGAIVRELNTDPKAFKRNEKVFEVALMRQSLELYKLHSVDVFDAAVGEHPNLPREFVDKRYPQMKQELERRRGK